MVQQIFETLAISEISQGQSNKPKAILTNLYLGKINDMSVTYILILVVLAGNGEVVTSKIADFNRMDQCFEAREKVIKQVGRPIINYQAFCMTYQPSGVS